MAKKRSRLGKKSSGHMILKDSSPSKAKPTVDEGYPAPASKEEAEAFLAALKRAKVKITKSVDDDYSTWLG